jgi:hypothetical protein
VARLTIYAGLTVGGIVGGYLPVAVFGVSWLSGWSILGGFVGAFVGLWLGFKLTQWIES